MTVSATTPTKALLLALVLASCTERALDCKLNLTCVEAGGAGGDGGATQAGGSYSGGGSGATSSGGESSTNGGTRSDACNDACTGTTPVCNEAAALCVECLSNDNCLDTTAPACDTSTNTCVGCLESADCTDSAMPVCDTTATTCVACLANTDCTTETASLCNTATNACVTCQNDVDCSHIPGKNVCSSGTCVQCTGTDYAACGQLAGQNLVCDSLTYTCSTDKTEQSVAECQECVSDAQCIAGQLCALQSFNSSSVGYFCFWKQGDTANGAPASCFANGRPYVKVDADVVSIDGTTATLCTLRTSTCTALRQFSLDNCALTGTPDDALCGFAPGVDSKCVETSTGSGVYRCTTACLSDDDCKPSLACNALTTPDTCSLQ